MAVEKDISEALMNDVLMIYSDAEDKMLKAVAKRVARGITTDGWNEQKLQDTQLLKKEIESVISNTTKMSSARVSKGIIDSYKSGKMSVGGKKGTHATILDDIDIPMNLKMLVLATNKLLDNASFQVLRNANDAYQEVMAHATTGLLSGVDTRIQASQKMLNEFARKGISSFVDKSGRNWSLSSYAEMSARTVGSHAALQGHIDRQLEVGEDLMKVSTIGTTCPICQRWQGVVLSISGNNPKYHSVDSAKAAGLFHPNCKHTMGMYIPELDDDSEFGGKVEPDPLDMTTRSSERNKLIEKQRSNERQIRYWKQRKAVAITPDGELRCNEKVKEWQFKNLIHCEKNDLRRQYAREGVMTGKATGPQGSLIGGSLKEYADVYKKVIGDDPVKVHKTLMSMDLTRFSITEWLRSEVKSLDDIDVDRAMMKDASKKDVTPTSLYKKYIGDTPLADYAEVSPYEKSTKEYKSGYAKWLKDEIDKIGGAYAVKPEYKFISEDVPVEDTKLSATEFYKKYHEGKKPTDAYIALGGEEATGVKYGRWVEAEKKALISSGISKKVPFDSVTLEKTRTIIKLSSEVLEKAKKSIDDPIIDLYKAEIAKIKEPKRISAEMKKMSTEMSMMKGREKEEAEKKYTALKERDLDLLRDIAKKETTTYEAEREMKWLKSHVLDKDGMPEEVKEHVRKKWHIWSDRKKEIMVAEEEAKRKEAERLVEEGRKKKIVSGIKMMYDDPMFVDGDIKDMIKLMKSGTDPDKAIKAKALEDIITDRKQRELDAIAAKKKIADDKKRQAELKKQAAEAAALRAEKAKARGVILSKGGYIPRCDGAKVLDHLTDYYKNNPAKDSARKLIDNTIGDIATNLKITNDEALKAVNRDLAAIVNECELGARVKSIVLKEILSDDDSRRGVKNLFETGTGGGCTNQSSRANGENEVFGYGHKGKTSSKYQDNKADRPYYGMMMPKYDGNDSDIDDYYRNGPGGWYGDGITVIFNKAVSEHVSFTMGDSLDYDSNLVGCELTKPEYRGSYSKSGFVSNYTKAKKQNMSPSKTLIEIADYSDHYMELQYHGREMKKELGEYIDHVYIRGHKTDIENLLTQKGIPFTNI